MALKPILFLSIGISFMGLMNSCAKSPEVKNRDLSSIPVVRATFKGEDAEIGPSCQTQIPDYLKDPVHPPFARVSAYRDLPAYSRVVIIQKRNKTKSLKVLYQLNGEIHSNVLPMSVILPVDSRASFRDEFNAYVSEAKFQLKLVHGIGSLELVPHFSALINHLDQSLECIEKNRSSLNADEWNQWVRESEAVISPDFSDKPLAVKRLTAELFQVMNPELKGRDLGSHTLYVPLSMQWIRKYPELEKYFQEKWVRDGHFDLKFMGGNSGEGISQTLPGSSIESEMNHYLLMLIDMKHAILKMNDRAIQESSEFKWLSKINSNTTKQFDRMIFIHENTWASQSRGWQDYIPIDQTIGPVHANPIFSVLIHETNVNSYSPEFFAQDTHSPMELSQHYWGCLGKNVTLHQINASTERQFQTMGLQPEIAMIYLGIELPKLAEKVGCHI